MWFCGCKSQGYAAVLTERDHYTFALDLLVGFHERTRPLQDIVVELGIEAFPVEVHSLDVKVLRICPTELLLKVGWCPLRLPFDQERKWPSSDLVRLEWQLLIN